MSDSNNKDKQNALVVDDSAMQCRMLNILLQQEGYNVLIANNGAEAVTLYAKHCPDLVLMDINMPVMNGFEAARKIKALSKGNLAPLIFITSLDSDQAFIDSVEAGGDGILIRPFSPDVFKAKIKSMQRISDLYSQVKVLQREQQKDAELAETLMSDAIESRNFSPERIIMLKQPAALFSGDIQLSALAPNGSINFLLGDFTGHGLRSSIGAIPLAETFRTMTKKGFSLFDIISHINQQLYDLLPKDLFLAVAFVSFSPHEQSAYVFNAGIPDVYFIDGEANIINKVHSVHPPLGVVKNLLPDSTLYIQAITEQYSIVMISDGIIEARNTAGEMYDITRFEQSIKQGTHKGNIAEQVMADVNYFCQQMPQEDDLSIVVFPCNDWDFEQVAQRRISNIHNSVLPTQVPVWRWQLQLTGQRLARVNPIPMAMNQLQEIEGAGEHWQSVYTIFTELFINALDHGVLALSSQLKSSPDGFAEYYKERQLRLIELTSGAIDIELLCFVYSGGGKIVIRITDDGAGFNPDSYTTFVNDKSASSLKLCGRGIELVKKIADHLTYFDHGRVAEAVYSW